MSSAFKLAWRYITYHKFSSLVLIACVVLTLFLPIAFSLMLDRFNEQIVSRAATTPAVIGAKGSRFDLTLDALYFQSDVDSEIPYQQVGQAMESGRALAIPLHLQFKARKLPVVGTSIEYFEFRDLQFQSGSLMTRLGDCVVGSKVAQKLNLSVGNQLKTDRDNDFDIASNPPLKMRVAGVLKPTGTADDEAIFVDVKTAWIIGGLGHGHDEKTEATTMGQDGTSTILNAAVASFLEITDENIGSFHFHGDLSEFPITAVLVVPNDKRAGDLLEGEYISDQVVQYVIPTTVVQELMSMVFRIKRFFDLNTVLISIATMLLLLLVALLSFKLRQREMETMFKLGCSRPTIATLQFAQLAIIGLFSLVAVFVLVSLTWYYAGDIIRSLLVDSSA